MSIQSSELVIRKAATATDTATNGGRMAKAAVTAGARGNFLPEWTLADSVTGKTRWRKFFLHVANDDDLELSQAGVHFLVAPEGDALLALCAGTQTDTQAALADSPALFGAGVLQAAAAAAATSFAVVIPDAAAALFRDGDTVCVCKWGSQADGSDATCEYHDNVTVSQVGAVVTVTLAAGDMLANAYDAGDTVSAVLPLGDLVAAIGTPAVTSSAGTVASASLLPDALGGISQTVTLTFTSATAFSAVSDVKGALGTGATSADFAPTNSDFSKPYFTIKSAAWGGTFAAGDVVSFTTTPAAGPFWLKGVLPAGAAVSPGAFVLGLRGGAGA